MRYNIFLLILLFNFVFYCFGYAQTENNNSLQKGIGFAKDGRYIEAIEELTKAIEIHPNYAEAYYMRATAYMAIKEIDKAILDCNEAINIDSYNSSAYNLRGIAYAQSGIHDIALSNFEKAIELDPQYSMAYNNMAIAYFNLGEMEKSKENINKAIQLGYKVNQDFLDTLNNILTLEKEKSILPAKESNLQQSVEYTLEAEYLLKEQEISEAITLLEKALELNPENFVALGDLGMAYAIKGELNKSEEYFKKSLAINNSFDMAYFGLGITYTDMNKKKEAQKAFKKAIELTDKDYIRESAGKALERLK